jgi:hypothetical protein
VVNGEVSKAVGIAFFLYVGFAMLFVAAYALGSTEFDLPAGPPIVALLSVLLACGAVMQLTRRS